MLSPGEKATLYAMVRFPSYNDRELARAIRAKQSTVTATRARLFERGRFSRVNIPSFRALGAGVLSICHDGVPSAQTPGPGANPRQASCPDGECDSFYALAAPSGWLEMGAFRDYSEAQRRGEWLRNGPAGHCPEAAGPPCIRSRFPMEMVRFHNLFDFSPLLARLFSIRGKAVGPRPLPDGPARRLSAVERLVLYGLVRWPCDPDRAVAGALGVSRQAVARVRRLLVGDGRLVPAVIPDCGKLGVELLALFHCRLDIRRPPEEQEGAREQVLGAVPHIFAMSAGPEVVALGAYERLADIEKGTMGTLRRLGDLGLLEGAPAVRTFLLEDSTFMRNLDFVPFVKSILGLSIAD